MCEAIQQFANRRYGYMGQNFENEVRTVFRTAGRDAVPPKRGLLLLVHVTYSQTF